MSFSYLHVAKRKKKKKSIGLLRVVSASWEDLSSKLMRLNVCSVFQ